MLIRKAGEAAWRAPAVTAYDDEAAIQALLAQSPELMPGASSQRFAVAREVALAAGYADLVGVTPDGDITLIECKLRANPEIRRHVVGQVLAYAATLWELDYADFDAAFAARTGTSLTSAVAPLANETWGEETFRAAVAANLATGRFRLVIAIDEITDELRRIVRFLNGHTTAELEVLALELRYVADSGVEILFPTTYGQESISLTAPQTWGEERFFDTVGPMMTTSGNLAARRLYDYARAHGARVQWGVGPYASVTARMTVAGKAVSVFNLSQWGKEGPKLYVHFEYLVGNVPMEALERLAEDLHAVPGMSAALTGLEAAEYRKRPSILLDSLSTDAVSQIEQAFGRLLSA